MGADGITLSVGYDGRMRAADAYEFRLAFSPVATLSLSRCVPLRVAVDDFVEPLRGIISLATGTSQDLTYVAVELEGQSGKYQVFGTAITQDPFESSSDKLRKEKSALRAKLDELSLLDLVLKWRHYTSEHHPLVETYGSMLHARDQHPRSRFLLLIQALEGSHGYETKGEYDKRKAKHVAKREDVLNRVQDTLGPKPKKFLKDFLLKNPPTSLESALKAMVSGLPVDMMDRLGKQGPGMVGRQGCDLRVRGGVTGVACGTSVAQGAEMGVLQATVSARTTPADAIFADHRCCRATRPGRAPDGAARHGARPA